MEWELKITLRSDLCVASGDGFSSGVDVDVCLDEAGMPLIPARRIKGCLREAAELVAAPDEQALVQELFGVRGSGVGGSITVGDARIRTLGGQDAGNVVEGSSVQEVTDLLTYVRAQTALVPGEGYAKENSLRYIRVVRQFDPLTPAAIDGHATPLTFVATIRAATSYDRLLLRSVKALRNIGFGRNRGLGAVSCRLSKAPARECGATTVIGKNGTCTRIALKVRLDTLLMLSQNEGGTSLGYVPGTSVLGFLAGRMSEEADFDDLFLSGKVRYSPLYPVDPAGLRCRPAPSFVVKAKGGLLDGSYRTCVAFSKLDEQTRLGVAPKSLRGGFVDGNWHPVDVRTEVIYHHSTGKTSGSDNPTLYTQRCLCAGQELAGFIEADDPKLLERVADALMACASKTGLSFGRSKTAQYAQCSLVEVKADEVCRPVSLAKGVSYAFLLDSDALVVDDARGCVHASYKSLIKQIRSALGESADVFECADAEEGAELPGTSLAFRTITGYNAKWNQKKPHVRAVAAGSSVVFKTAKDAVVPGEFRIGSRQAEGFGRVLVVPLEQIGDPIEAVVGQRHLATGAAPNPSLPLRERRRIERMRNVVIDYAERVRSGRLFDKSRLNPALVGRIAQMVEESSSRVELKVRISSISRASKRADAEALMSGLLAHLSSAGYEDLSWEETSECLLLTLTLGKYYAKQGDAVGSSQANGGSDE